MSPADCRTVVLGGGTGLSTIVGGGSQDPAWADAPFVGLKQVFPRLDVAVVTTDDGGSTGLLLRRFPLLGIGDLRKSCLSLILRERLEKTYRLDPPALSAAVKALREIFTRRFEPGTDPAVLADPAGRLLACPELLPSPLREGLSRLGGWIVPGGGGPDIEPSGHCLGNLILAAAVFRAAGRWDRPVPASAWRRGLDEVARLIGAAPGRLHPVTTVPGQLIFRYADGVEVLGQRKAALVRRSSPVERVTGVYPRLPSVPSSLVRALEAADLVIYAPGSLYSSMIPLLQHPAVLAALRGNRRALKVLAANFWIQEGETDLVPGSSRRGFSVSDLVRAYDRNLAGGSAGLFDVILGTDLERLSGGTLGSYAREGKVPIHFDRERLRRMGLRSVEAELLPPRPAGGIHHDPNLFARAVCALLKRPRPSTTSVRPAADDPRLPRVAPIPLPCRHERAAAAVLEKMKIQPARWRGLLLDLSWEHRDIAPAHLASLGSVTRSERVRRRSVGVDYFPATGEVRISSRADARRALLIGLGEAVLGRFLCHSREKGRRKGGPPGPSCLELRLAAPPLRRSLLDDRRLRRFLDLAGFVPSREDPDVYRAISGGGREPWPPGLLFGMFYAWYLDPAAAPAIEHEMAGLGHRPPGLMPWQVRDLDRRQDLVDFFREEVFSPA